MNHVIEGLKDEHITPEWTIGATDRIGRFLMNDDAVWEWGCGRSTIWLAERAKKVFSIEHDYGRYNTVAVELGLRGLTNATIFFVGESKAYAHSILSWKRKFHLLAINERGPFSRLECATMAVRKSFKGSLIVLNDSHNIAHHIENEFLSDWTANKSGRKEQYLEQLGSHEWETSVYSRP